eukprot:4883432-Amphidinium_carterae.1
MQRPGGGICRHLFPICVLKLDANDQGNLILFLFLREQESPLKITVHMGPLPLVASCSGFLGSDEDSPVSYRMHVWLHQPGAGPLRPISGRLTLRPSLMCPLRDVPSASL